LHGRKISIAIPASVVSDIPHLREKTSKMGLIGRAAAIFRVEEIIIYLDNPKMSQKADMDLIATLLTYMETPQYLRRRLFSLRPELQYAGTLPPLRTAHHPLNRKVENLKVGEYREGIPLSLTKEGMLVDIGVERPALIVDSQEPVGKRVTVRIIGVDRQVEVELADRNDVPEYWGYTVAGETCLFGKMVESRNFDLTIATSRYGVPFTDVVQQIEKGWRDANTILVAFGAPTKGLNEIVRQEGLRLEDIADFVVNTIPKQGTETVRTEEALIASLAIFNIYFRF
jgi:predicted SPOUT superfamily RNA methylase MTH1